MIYHAYQITISQKQITRSLSHPAGNSGTDALPASPARSGSLLRKQLSELLTGPTGVQTLPTTLQLLVHHTPLPSEIIIVVTQVHYY